MKRLIRLILLRFCWAHQFLFLFPSISPRRMGNFAFKLHNTLSSSYLKREIFSLSDEACYNLEQNKVASDVFQRRAALSLRQGGLGIPSFLIVQGIAFLAGRGLLFNQFRQIPNKARDLISGFLNDSTHPFYQELDGIIGKLNSSISTDSKVFVDVNDYVSRATSNPKLQRELYQYFSNRIFDEIEQLLAPKHYGDRRAHWRSASHPSSSKFLAALPRRLALPSLQCLMRMFSLLLFAYISGHIPMELGASLRPC